MPDEVKLLIKATLLAAWIAATLLGVLWFFNLRREFNNRIAEDIKDVGRTMAMANEASREAGEYLDAGDIDGYTAVMDRHRARMEQHIQDQDAARKRRYPGIDWGDEAAEAADAEPVRMAVRHDGAFYPEDYVQPSSAPEETSSFAAAAIAGIGGLGIFLGTGFVAWRILGVTTQEEEESAPEAADEQTYVVIGGADGGAPAEAPPEVHYAGDHPPEEAYDEGYGDDRYVDDEGYGDDGYADDDGSVDDDGYADDDERYDS